MASARVERLPAPVLTVAALGAATLALHLRDPHRQGSWGVCPLNAITGLYCPGCGGLRAVNNLTDGDIRAAASSNLLVTVGIPIAVVVLALWLLSAWRGTTAPRLPVRWRQPLWVVIVVAMAAFALVRNLPLGSGLAP